MIRPVELEPHHYVELLDTEVKHRLQTETKLRSYEMEYSSESKRLYLFVNTDYMQIDNKLRLLNNTSVHLAGDTALQQFARCIAKLRHTPVSLSLGVSFFPADGTDAPAPINVADHAMLEMKRSHA